MPTLNILSSLFTLKLCTNSSIPSDKNAIVLPTSTEYSLFPILNANNVNNPSIKPSIIIFHHKPSENRLFLGLLGSLFIMFSSSFSSPNAIAGRESVTKLIHSNCIASNGDFIPNISPTNIVTISPIFVAIKK